MTAFKLKTLGCCIVAQLVNPPPASLSSHVGAHSSHDCSISDPAPSYSLGNLVEDGP